MSEQNETLSSRSQDKVTHCQLSGRDSFFQILSVSVLRFFGSCRWFFLLWRWVLYSFSLFFSCTCSPQMVSGRALALTISFSFLFFLFSYSLWSAFLFLYFSLQARTLASSIMHPIPPQPLRYTFSCNNTTPWLFLQGTRAFLIMWQPWRWREVSLFFFLFLALREKNIELYGSVRSSPDDGSILTIILSGRCWRLLACAPWFYDICRDAQFRWLLYLQTAERVFQADDCSFRKQNTRCTHALLSALL